MLVDALRARGATVSELRSYEWRLPDDVEPIEALIAELIDGRLDAVAFTNQVQVRHLFEVGARIGPHARRCAMRSAIAPSSAPSGRPARVALEQYGVPPHVVASPPKMRPLVTAVGEHLAARRSHPTARRHS